MDYVSWIMDYEAIKLGHFRNPSEGSRWSVSRVFLVSVVLELVGQLPGRWELSLPLENGIRGQVRGSMVVAES